MSIVEEIYRIKNLMLSESFKGSEKIIEKYVEKLIEKIGGEKLFDSFFEGEKTLREFREEIKNKILKGDFGDTIGEVNNNLKYLKNIGAILGTLEREYNNNPDEFEKLNYDGTIPEDEILKNINQRVLYGEFCRDCKNPKDVKNFIDYEIEKIETIQQETERFNNPEQFRKAANKFFGTHDYPGLKPFIYKGFWDNLRTMFGILDKKGYDRNLKELKDRYGIYSMQWALSQKDESVLDFSKLPQLKLSFQENYEIKVSGAGINYKFEKGRQYPFAYIDEKRELFHRTPKGKGDVFDIYIKLPTKLPPRKDITDDVLEGKIMKIIPLGGTVIEVDTKIDVEFTITR